MTDERPAVISGYGENTSQPPADAGGSIAQVEASRTQAEITDPRLEKEKCRVPGCGKLITKKNMEQHRRNIHKLYKRGPHGKKPNEAVDTRAMESKPKRVKVTTEEIIVTVVSLRWPNGVPVDKISSLLLWATATERFLNE
jgi:hypothetical protein